jgi:hypothetical protein
VDKTGFRCSKCLFTAGFPIRAHFNSASILFGLGRHQAYSKTLLAEAILSIVGMILVLPRFGLLGAAWLTNGLMALNRGGLACLLICRELGVSAWQHAFRIYAAPCTIGALSFVLLLCLGNLLHLLAWRTQGNGGRPTPPHRQSREDLNEHRRFITGLMRWEPPLKSSLWPRSNLSSQFRVVSQKTAVPAPRSNWPAL